MNKQEFDGIYNLEVQKILLSHIIEDEDLFVRCRSILKDEYFDDQLRRAVRFILSHSDEHRSIPSSNLIKAKTGTEIIKLSDMGETLNEDWFLGEIEQFCRHRALENIMLESYDLIQKGQYSNIEAKVKDAMTISLVSDLGTNYFTSLEETKNRLRRMTDKSAKVSTGWKSLDEKLYGGFERGGLNIFMGYSGCVIAGTKIRIIKLRDQRYCDTEEKLNDLYLETQPTEINIEELYQVNTGEKYLCDSPDGWVPIEEWRNKGEKNTICLECSEGQIITASVDHLFQLSNGAWVYTEDLKIGDSLLSANGNTKITKLYDAGVQTVYDLAIGHENHRYYTNGISSHNSGKSLFLQNLALNWVLSGYNVIYFSLELNEDLISTRFDSMLTGKSTKEVFQTIDDTSLMVCMKGKKAGSLYIKKMPPAGTCVNDFRAFVKEYQIKTGKKPDGIISDYLDLMYPNDQRMDLSNLFVKDKYVSEELRGLMHETDTFGATASQTNREGGKAQGELEQNHIAGGLSKINTTDNLFGINAPFSMKEKGEVELVMIKTRSSNSTGQRLKLAYDPICMRISDMEIDVEKKLSREELMKIAKGDAEIKNVETSKEEDVGDNLTSLAKMLVRPKKDALL